MPTGYSGQVPINMKEVDENVCCFYIERFAGTRLFADFLKYTFSYHATLLTFPAGLWCDRTLYGDKQPSEFLTMSEKPMAVSPTVLEIQSKGNSGLGHFTPAAGITVNNRLA